jgi:hypothetical protein
MSPSARCIRGSTARSYGSEGALLSHVHVCLQSAGFPRNDSQGPSLTKKRKLREALPAEEHRSQAPYSALGPYVAQPDAVVVQDYVDVDGDEDSDATADGADSQMPGRPLAEEKKLRASLQRALDQSRS